MEFAWNLQKNLMSDVKGLEKEQNREGKISNAEIKPNMTRLNHDLIESELNLYQRVKKRVEEVRSVSRVQKNSIVDCSNIITVPKAQALIWGKEKTEDYFKAVCEIFKEQFGTENIVSAMVHLDESAPHMHLHFVPVSQEGKLQARKVTTREKIKFIHDEAPKRLQELGFEVTRGMGVTEKSLEIHKYKATKLKEDIKELDIKLKALESDFKALEDICASIDDIEHIDVKEGFLGGKVTLKKDDYDKLKSLAKQGVVNANKVDELTRINEKLIEDVKSNKKGLKEARGEHLEIKTEFIGMKKKFKDLREQSEAMFEVLKKHNLVPEAKEYLQAKRVADKVLNKNKSWDMER